MIDILVAGISGIPGPYHSHPYKMR